MHGSLHLVLIKPSLWTTCLASNFVFFLGTVFAKNLSYNHQTIGGDNIQGLVNRGLRSELRGEASRSQEFRGDMTVIKRRNLIGLVFGVSGLTIETWSVKGAGLPPEEKPRLCDKACEKELENVWFPW